MEQLKEELPGLKRSQYKERIFALWKKSPDNPMNQQVASTSPIRFVPRSTTRAAVGVSDVKNHYWRGHTNQTTAYNAKADGGGDRQQPPADAAMGLFG